MMDIERATAVQPVELSFKIVTDNGLVLDVQGCQPVVLQDSSAPPLEFFELPKQDKKQSLSILFCAPSVSAITRRLRR